MRELGSLPSKFSWRQGVSATDHGDELVPVDGGISGCCRRRFPALGLKYDLFVAVGRRLRAVQRSVNASLALSPTNAAANVRRIQVSTRGLEMTCRRTQAAASP
jgi:hypothetical protein